MNFRNMMDFLKLEPLKNRDGSLKINDSLSNKDEEFFFEFRYIFKTIITATFIDEALPLP